MDVHELIAQLRTTVEGARAMPMSASAVINRAEVLAQIEELEATVPTALAQSDEVFLQRDQIVGAATSDAERIVADAQSERDRLVSETEVFRVAKTEADRLKERVQRDCELLRRETDEYVDTRLANFEITLSKTLDAVHRGRERLSGRSELDQETLDAAAQAGHPEPFPTVG
ncbi:MAG: hypothetical protein ACRDPG_00145 [Nocardioidaceae bacterium]